jgi:hypothetical protein
MKRSALFGTLVVLSLGATARADFIPWKFNWTPSATTLFSDTSPDSKITLTNEPLGNATGPSDIVATNLKVFSNAPRGTPDMFGGAGSNFSLTLRLTDATSGMFSDLAFGGNFSGSLSAFSSDLDVNWTGNTGYTVTLGDTMTGFREYMVTIGPYSPPGPPDSDNSGGIGAHVEVRALDIQKAPEPSTMLLSCVGLSFLGLGAWRKRRQQGRVA